jgi:hypothetical protein
MDAKGVASVIWIDGDTGDDQIVSSVRAPWLTGWLPALRADDAPAEAEVSSPQIAVHRRDHVVAVWSDDRSGDADVYAASLLPPPGGWGPAVRISDNPPGMQQVNPAVAVDPAGTVYVVWEERTTEPERSELRWATRPANGAWTVSRSITPPGPKDERWPSLALDQDGGLHLVWADLRPTGSVISWSLLPSGDSGWQPTRQVSAPAGPGTEAPTEPDVAVGAMGTVHVVWQDYRAGETDPDIYMALRPRDTAQWMPDQRVNQGGAGSAQSEPSVALGADGTVFVVWTDERDSSEQTPNPDVYLATYAANERRWLDEKRVNDDPEQTPAIQQAPDIVADHKGGALIAWEDGRSAETGRDIFAAVIQVLADNPVYLPLLLKP